MALEVPVIAALITAVASLAVAILSMVSSRTSQKRQMLNQAELQRYQRDLKRLQDELDQKAAERDARRDYEYEAKKHLYHECSPLLFQLSDQAASALERIQGLAESAAQGKLGAGAASWLSADRFRYYRASTEYRLLAPLATLKLLKQRLTKLDLSLDPEIYLLYSLARQAGRVLSDDFTLAKLSPVCRYDPHDDDARLLSKVDPATYWQQGVPRGILDNAIDALLVKDGDGCRIMSFLEFEAVRHDEHSAAGSALARVGYLFKEFHPQHRPVLWRLLLATASIYRAIGLISEREHGRAPMGDPVRLLVLPQDERAQFAWQADGQQAASAADFEAVESYLQREFEKVIRRINTGSAPSS